MKAQETKKQWLTAQETADYLGVQLSTIYSYTHKRTIPFRKVNGRKIYFLKSDLENFIKNGQFYDSKENIETEALNRMIKAEV